MSQTMKTEADIIRAALQAARDAKAITGLEHMRAKTAVAWLECRLIEAIEERDSLAPDDGRGMPRWTDEKEG